MSSKNLLYNKSLGSQFGICELYVDEDRSYQIVLSDFYGHLQTSVYLEREEFVDLVNAITDIRAKNGTSSAVRKRMEVKAVRADADQMITLEISKEKEWMISILFYTKEALDDFANALEDMVAF